MICMDLLTRNYIMLTSILQILSVMHITLHQALVYRCMLMHMCIHTHTQHVHKQALVRLLGVHIIFL